MKGRAGAGQTAADHVVKAAGKPKAKLSSVGQKALVLTDLLASMNGIIERESNEAADHLYLLKSIAQDEINLGEAEMTSSGVEDDDEDAAILIEHIKTIAESVRNSARQYAAD
jgi:hypothetical protein